MQKRPTSSDVARLAGVSRVTVSMILNGKTGVSFSDETCKRVFKAAQELGYRPQAAGRMLALGSAETIGVVVCNAELLAHDGFVPQVLQAMATSNREHGYRIILEAVDGAAAGDVYENLVGSRQIDGLVVIDPISEDARLRRLIDEGFPVVLLGSVRHPQECSINFPTTKAIQLVVDHLIALGHRRIAHVTHSPLGYVSSDARHSALKKAMKKRKLEFDDELLAYGEFSAESGYRATKEMLNRVGTAPEAVFAGNDTIAIGVAAAAREFGLDIPADIAIVGFDDLPASAYLNPPLTTVRNPAKKQGTLAIETIVRLLRGEKVQTKRIIVPVELIVRQSTAG